LDKRLESLEAWLRDSVGLAEFSIRPASADASFRRYFRVFTAGTSLIAMDAPPEKEDVSSFVHIALRFSEIGLNVPRPLETDATSGFLLLTDLGDRLYLRYLDESTVEQLYGDAMRALIVLQSASVSDPGFLPPYDRGLLEREMGLFREWFLERHLGMRLTDEENFALERVFAALADSALEQPAVWVHRDYHSRNLMVTPRNNPGILDFQDAVSGPVTYDLVSLLRDCYVAWPRERVEQWAKEYFALGRRSGLPVGGDVGQFLEWFDRMGVQRHLKATGIFARLNHRDGKPDYLKDIPRTLGYVHEVAGRYRDLAPLAGLVERSGGLA